MYYIAEKLSKWGVERRYCQEKDRDIIRFGIEVIFSQIFTFMPIVMYALLSKDTISIFVMIITFASLRIMGKGYHAKRFVDCFLLTNLILFLTVIFSNFTAKYLVFNLTVSLIFIIYILYCSCIEKKLKEHKYIYFQKLVVLVCFFTFLGKILEIDLLNFTLIQNITIIAYFLSKKR